MIHLHTTLTKKYFFRFAYVSESAYAQKYAPDRETVKRIFKNIKIIMHDHINASKWMNHTHKAYALNKLQKVKIMIGGPDEVFDTRKFDEFLGIDKVNNKIDFLICWLTRFIFNRLKIFVCSLAISHHCY